MPKQSEIDSANHLFQSGKVCRSSQTLFAHSRSRSRGLLGNPPVGSHRCFPTGLTMRRKS